MDELLATIPELAGCGPIDCQPLNGGLSNRSFLLTLPESRLVLRLNQDTPGVDREREAIALTLAAELGIGAPIVANRPAAGYCLSEFIQAPAWTGIEARDPRQLQRLARCLRQLHQSAASLPVLEPVAVLHTYLKRPEIRGLEIFSSLCTAVDQLQGLLEIEGYQEHMPALCHHDLALGNILGKQRVWLIDWEFAALGNPLLDLATFINYNDLSPDQYAPLLEAYFGSWPREQLGALGAALRLAQLLELLWLLSCRNKLPAAVQQRLRQLLVVWS